MTSAWQLWLLWGVAVGLGTGSMALVFGAIVANRWFVTRRGLVIGHLLGRRLDRPAGLPAGDRPASPTARAGAGRPGWSRAFALLLVPLVCWLLRDRPADVGTAPYGAARDSTSPPAGAGHAQPGAAPWRSRTLRESARAPAFWVLFGTFWICGWSTNGLIGTHFIPAAHDHGMPPTTAPACSP